MEKAGVKESKPTTEAIVCPLRSCTNMETYQWDGSLWKSFNLSFYDKQVILLVYSRIMTRIKSTFLFLTFSVRTVTLWPHCHNPCICSGTNAYCPLSEWICMNAAQIAGRCWRFIRQLYLCLYIGLALMRKRRPLMVKQQNNFKGLMMYSGTICWSGHYEELVRLTVRLH